MHNSCWFTHYFYSHYADSLWPGDAKWRWTSWSTLLQVMACCLLGAKPLPETMLNHCQLEPEEHISIECDLNLKVLIQENAFENVCKMLAILFRPQCINSFPPGQNGCHLTDNVFWCIFRNDKFCILIKISLKFIPKGPIDSNPALV